MCVSKKYLIEDGRQFELAKTMNPSGDVEIRPATPEDADEIVEFVAKHIASAHPLCRALQWDEADARANYEHKIRDSLPDGLSYVAIDVATREIVGCSVASVWHRDPAKNRPSPPPSTEKAKHVYAIVSHMRSLFWELCPKEVTTVFRGECMLVRADMHRRKIAARMTAQFPEETHLRKHCVGGMMGVPTSLANQRNMSNFGAITLAEMSYEEYFVANGIPFEGAFTDGTEKATLTFTPFAEHKHYRPNYKVVLSVTKSKL